MAEPTLICPNCQTEIKLTESLAAPLLEATRAQFRQQLAQKDSDIAVRERAMHAKEAALLEARRAFDKQVADQVAAQLQTERTKIADNEAHKARLATAAELEQKTRDLADLRSVLQQRDEKLAAAQQEQAALVKKQRALDDAKRELDLTIEQRVQEGLAANRELAKQEAEAELNLKIAEKDQTIAAMQKNIVELKRRADQGSQQLQGEVQELELENLLTSKFPFDVIEPVAKGEFGGDVLQRVSSTSGQRSGTILWETKRTKRWSDAWLAKLRDDQRAAKAEIAVLVSQALPKTVAAFDVIDGIWVTDPRTAMPVATVLRQSLLEITNVRRAAIGQQTKTDMIYQYLTGPNFRHRVEAIVEAFSTMRQDLDKEKKAISRQWAKREAQIDRVMNATVGLYGDLQGIAGASLQEIEGLELKALAQEEPQG